MVLAASCAYFDAMFNVGLEESHKGYVALPSVPPDILPMIIDFIYTGNVTFKTKVVLHTGLATSFE